MGKTEEITKKEFAVYLGYGLGIFLMLFGAFIPTAGEQIWMTVLGGILVLGAHQSYEAMLTRALMVKIAIGNPPKDEGTPE
ncbi:MAG: hypothetical protein WC489_06105 [Patescibacteria group bacterium]|jgi:hypothetical protein